MQGRDIIVIGASVGGIEAVSKLLSGLPPDLNAAVFVVIHIGAAESRLAQVLNRTSKLPVSQAVDGAKIVPGHVYVAAPDHHLVLTPGEMRLVFGPREHFTRPAIDPLFRSAALSFGSRVIGVVLTGGRADGAAGLLAIKDFGGIGIVQDPADAFAPSMPRSAIARVAVDHICPLSEIPALLTRYDPPDPGPAPAQPSLIELEHKLSVLEICPAGESELNQLGVPSSLTCPECGGVLYCVRDTRLLRYRCAAGHAMAAETLLERLEEVREQASWSAVRAITEEAALLRQMSDRYRDDSAESSAGLHRAERLTRCADQLEVLIGAEGE